MALFSTALAHSRHRDLLQGQFRTLDGRALRDEIEAEGQRRGDDLAKMPDLHVHLRNAPTVRVGFGDPDDGLGYGKLVQGSALFTHIFQKTAQHMVDGRLHLLDAWDVVRAHDYRMIC